MPYTLTYDIHIDYWLSLQTLFFIFSTIVKYPIIMPQPSNYLPAQSPPFFSFRLKTFLIFLFSTICQLHLVQTIYTTPPACFISFYCNLGTKTKNQGGNYTCVSPRVIQRGDKFGLSLVQFNKVQNVNIWFIAQITSTPGVNMTNIGIKLQFMTSYTTKYAYMVVVIGYQTNNYWIDMVNIKLPINPNDTQVSLPNFHLDEQYYSEEINFPSQKIRLTSYGRWVSFISSFGLQTGLNNNAMLNLRCSRAYGSITNITIQIKVHSYNTLRTINCGVIFFDTLSPWGYAVFASYDSTQNWSTNYGNGTITTNLFNSLHLGLSTINFGLPFNTKCLLAFRFIQWGWINGDANDNYNNNDRIFTLINSTYNNYYNITTTTQTYKMIDHVYNFLCIADQRSLGPDQNQFIDRLTNAVYNQASECPVPPTIPGSHQCQNCTQLDCINCNTAKRNQCILCNATLYTKLGGTGGKTCVCVTWAIRPTPSSFCQPCVPNCLTCVLSNCSQCQTNYFLASFDTCVACHYSCQTCSKATTNCTSCLSSNFRTLIGNQCVPILGYFESGKAMASPCHFSCQSCSILSTNCTSCMVSNFRTLSGNLCIPNQGYFDSGSATALVCDLSCSACIITAKNCINCNNMPVECTKCQFGFCTGCIQGYQLTHYGLCIKCEIPGCTKCSHPNFCIECVVNQSMLTPSPNGDACYTCNSTNRQYLNGCQKCNGTNSCGLCNQELEIYSFTKNSQYAICLSCSFPNCVKCTTKISDYGEVILACIQCAKGFHSTSNGYYCYKCSYPCTECPQTYRYINETENICKYCQTPKFYLVASANGTCIQNLIPGCFQANQTNSQLCATCSFGYFLSADKLKCEWICSPFCKQCTSNNNCSLCIIGYYVNANKSCSKCEIISCQECTLNGSTCLRCIKGFFLSGNECKVCPGYCLNCSNYGTCNELVEKTNQLLVKIDGQSVLAVCESTCVTCSSIIPSKCLKCVDGFFRQNDRCIKCGGNCKTCSSSNKNFCLTCYPFNMLSSLQNTCRVCNSNCKTCIPKLDTENITKCTSCWDGFHLSGDVCLQGCPLNCFDCFNITTCIQCLSGYTTFKGNQSVLCVPCESFCRTCAQNRPSICLSCGKGFYIEGETCKKCQTSCDQCTKTQCLSCYEGFFMTSERICALNCILPCATCSSNDSKKCLSCIAGYSLNSTTNTCQQKTSCSGGCTVCPMGFSLKGGLCLNCSISNCHTCNPDNVSICYSCKPGFYLKDDGSCDACEPQCRTCFSLGGCLSCSSGFTKKKNSVLTKNGSECVKCNARCATCIGTADYCTSCASGYEFFGWKCIQKFRFDFSVTFLVPLDVFQQNYMLMIDTFAIALMVRDIERITIFSIEEGSVILNGSAAPTEAPNTIESGMQFKSFSELFKNTVIAGMQVGKSSIEIKEGSVLEISEPSSIKPLVLILGICIPVFLVIIIAVILCLYCRSQRPQKIMDFQGSFVDEGANNKEIQQPPLPKVLETSEVRNLNQFKNIILPPIKNSRIRPELPDISQSYTLQSLNEIKQQIQKNQ